MATNKPTLHLAPPGMPTLDALIAMSRALTGRDPTPEELALVKAEIAAYELGACSQPMGAARYRHRTSRV